MDSVNQDSTYGILKLGVSSQRGHVENMLYKFYENDYLKFLNNNPGVSSQRGHVENMLYKFYESDYPKFLNNNPSDCRNKMKVKKI